MSPSIIILEIMVSILDILLFNTNETEISPNPMSPPMHTSADKASQEGLRLKPEIVNTLMSISYVLSMGLMVTIVIVFVYEMKSK